MNQRTLILLLVIGLFLNQIQSLRHRQFQPTSLEPTGDNGNTVAPTSQPSNVNQDLPEGETPTGQQNQECYNLTESEWNDLQNDIALLQTQQDERRQQLDQLEDGSEQKIALQQEYDQYQDELIKAKSVTRCQNNNQVQPTGQNSQSNVDGITTENNEQTLVVNSNQTSSQENTGDNQRQIFELNRQGQGTNQTVFSEVPPENQNYTTYENTNQQSNNSTDNQTTLEKNFNSSTDLTAQESSESPEVTTVTVDNEGQQNEPGSAQPIYAPQAASQGLLFSQPMETITQLGWKISQKETQYKNISNLNAPNWIVGNQSIDDYSQQLFQFISNNNITKCPSDTPFLQLVSQRCIQCEGQTPVFDLNLADCTACPPGTQLDTDRHVCSQAQCAGGQMWDETNSQCVSADKCSSNYVWDQNSQTCICPVDLPIDLGCECVTCLEPFVWDSTQQVCKQKCQQTFVWNSQTQTCQCPSQAPHIVNGICIACNLPFQWHEQTHSCTFKQDQSCKQDIQPHSTDQVTKQTTNECTSNYVYDENVKACVCPTELPFNDGAQCVSCQLPKFWDHSTRQCLYCPQYQYFSVNQNECLPCPLDKPLFVNHICQACPADTIYDSQTNTCKNSGPSFQEPQVTPLVPVTQPTSTQPASTEPSMTSTVPITQPVINPYLPSSQPYYTQPSTTSTIPVSEPSYTEPSYTEPSYTEPSYTEPSVRPITPVSQPSFIEPASTPKVPPYSVAPVA